MTTLEIIIEIKNEIKNDLGNGYFEGEYNGEDICIRFGKDHSRNFKRNSDDRKHNLSLINVRSNGSQQDSYFTTESWGKEYLQVQKYGVMDLEDVEKEINEFLNEVESYIE